MKIAFASCAARFSGFTDDQVCAELLDARIEVWNDPAVEWSAYDRVVIRSTWDYTSRIDEFLAWCRAVGEQRLRNRPELVEFNSDKRYLAQLTVPTVPTTFLQPGQSLPPLERETVIKPSISAGARDTGRFRPGREADAAALLDRIHAAGRTALMQPYIPSVDTEGETAIVFIGGELSHVLHKQPVLRTDGVAPLSELAHGPAAVMLEEDLVTAGVANAAQLELAHAAHAEISARFGTPLYLRVDTITDPERLPVVIELEAIEPCLYLGLVNGAAERLAAAIRAC